MSKQRMAKPAEAGKLQRFAGLAISGLISFALPIAGQSIVIDAGSASDTGYSSPAGYPTTVYTIPSPIPLAVLPPGTNDLTLRYGRNFAYDIQVPAPGWYTILLNFIEVSATGPGQRIFSVWANDQPIIENLDLYAAVGFLVPTARSALVSIPGTSLHLSFVASVRGMGHDTALISAITVSYADPAGAAAGGIWIVPSVGGQSVDGEIPAGANTSFTLAFAPNPPTSLHCYRNGSRMLPGPLTYSLAGNVLTVTTPLQPAEALVVDYRH